MIRRVPLRLSMLVATAAVALSACATFTDANIAARVGDVELSHDDLDQLRSATIAEFADFGELNAGDAHRFIAQAFVLVETIHADLDTLGVSAPDRTEASTLADLQTQLQEAGASWQSVPPEELGDDAVATIYASGEANLVCAAHILTDTEADALAAIERIEAGEPFGAVAAEMSIGPSGPDGGRLDCAAADTFETTYVPEFVEGASGLGIGEISEPVESQFGFHVITKRAFADIDPGVMFNLRVRSFAERYDIYVDPTIGEWTGDGSITPLG